ncbi:hypothetical protein SLEP1_g59365 [Rubroshorea leprosula]|uniref:Uncharacterized protein n=1 Tax=Rubroshorea leprosula TaxID=152421 RepID=A0AAV5MTN4_9ROSI|nr:hypothetical protein SLEP1_g59365 [Rubroshorea leprosula]
MPAYQVTDSPVLTHPGSAGRDLVLNGRNAGYSAKLVLMTSCISFN